MGEVVELFPRAKGAPWRYGDLKGQTPLGHAGVKHGWRGNPDALTLARNHFGLDAKGNRIRD